MTIIKKQGFDLDFSKFDIEIIILMAQAGSLLARNELIERYYPHVKCQVDQLACRYGFRPEDVADAEQEAVFATVEAIEKYDLQQANAKRRCSFDSYLYMVVERRFLNRLQASSRQAKHFHASAGRSLSLLWENPAVRLQVRTQDPSFEAEESEFWQRWSRAVDHLNPEYRRICDAIIDGKPLERISDELAIPLRTLERRKKEILVQLSTALRA